MTGGAEEASLQTDQTGLFSLLVFLNPLQENFLSVTATDRAGNTSEPAELVVVHDDMDPEIQIYSPADGELVETQAITVNGFVHDEALAGVTVNGERFLAQVVLTEGLNTITATVLDSGGNTAEETVVVFKGEEGQLPEAFGVVRPGEETTIEITDPDSSIEGARVIVPAGAVSGEGVLLIGSGDADTPVSNGLIEVGPAVSVDLEGAQLTGEVIARVPYSPELTRFYRLPENVVGLMLHEAASGTWQQIEATSIDKVNHLVEGPTSNLSLIQAGASSPDFTIDTIAGVEREVGQVECESEPIPDPDPDGPTEECKYDQPQGCVCAPGAYEGPAAASLIWAPYSIDSVSIGSEDLPIELLTFNENVTVDVGGEEKIISSVNYLYEYGMPGTSYTPHLKGILRSEFSRQEAGEHYRYTAVAVKFDKELGETKVLVGRQRVLIDQPGDYPVSLGSQLIERDLYSGQMTVLAGGGSNPGDQSRGRSRGK